MIEGLVALIGDFGLLQNTEKSWRHVFGAELAVGIERYHGKKVLGGDSTIQRTWGLLRRLDSSCRWHACDANRRVYGMA
jgi:hypothetical protein